MGACLGSRTIKRKKGKKSKKTNMYNYYYYFLKEDI